MSAKTPNFRSPALMLCATTALCAGLVGCKVDNRPLLSRNDAPATFAAPGAPLDANYAYAPGPLDLPYAQPAQVMPAPTMYDGYALAERAYAYDRAAYQAPPDYGFRYGDVEPWVWRTAGDDLMFAEPIDDGYRTYYYEPGASHPYFVRDPSYGYAYGQNGALTALFSAAGALLPNTQLYQVADIAGRYLARGYDLRQTYYSAPRFAVAEPIWTAREPLLVRTQQTWIEGLERQPAWREYRVRDPELPDFHLARERAVAGPPPWANGPPAHAVARGLRERGWTPPAEDLRRVEAARKHAENAFEHQSQAVAREARHEDRDVAKAQRHEMREAAKSARHDARAFARNDAVVRAPEMRHEAQKHEDHGGKGGERHDPGGHDDKGKHGGEGHGGGDHGGGKGHGKH